jgi:hypothetical protein
MFSKFSKFTSNVLKMVISFLSFLARPLYKATTSWKDSAAK